MARPAEAGDPLRFRLRRRNGGTGDVIGLGAAVVGGLGSICGAILGGLPLAAPQTVGGVALPLASTYRDGSAFAAVIAIIARRSTGRIAKPESGRV